MEKIKNILKFAMRLEKQGENFFTFYADQVKDPYTKDVFEKLASIEGDHYRFLKKKYDELFFAKELHDISWVIDSSDVIHTSIFADATVPVSNIDADGAVSDLAILRLAYTIEDDFSTFYLTASEHIEDPDIKKFLITLSEWEKEHQELFYGFYKQQLKDSWSDFEHMLVK